MTLNHELFAAISMAAKELRSQDWFPAEGYERFGHEFAAELTRYFQEEAAAKSVNYSARKLDRLGRCIAESLVTITRKGELTFGSAL